MNTLASNPLQNGNRSVDPTTQIANDIKQMGNPQMIAQQILQNNPEFAKFYKGLKNPQLAAMQALRSTGIDFNRLMRML